MPEKIPIELLLKYSRREVGELKSEIDELKYQLVEKDKEIQKLNRKLSKYKEMTQYLNPNRQVNRNLSQILSALEHIKKPGSKRKEHKRINLYKRTTKFYNAWYDGCKTLLSILQELRTLHFE